MTAFREKDSGTILSGTIVFHEWASRAAGIDWIRADWKWVQSFLLRDAKNVVHDSGEQQENNQPCDKPLCGHSQA